MSAAGVAITAAAAATADELAAAARAVAADLPFAAEPAAYLVALERLAADGDGQPVPDEVRP
ncbi:MAG: hypothetical protein U1E17_24170 [Geminicoccaceae bacterium]